MVSAPMSRSPLERLRRRRCGRPWPNRCFWDRRSPQELIDEAARSALTQCSPIDDHRASAEYRCDMVYAMTRRALNQVFLHEEDMMDEINISVNGKEYKLQVKPWATLLEVIREDLGLTGTKEGCGGGECGACTVIMDGQIMNACLVLAMEADWQDRSPP